MNVCPHCGNRETLLRGIEWHDHESEKWKKPEQGFIVSESCYSCNRDFSIVVWQDVNRVRIDL